MSNRFEDFVWENPDDKPKEYYFQTIVDENGDVISRADYEDKYGF